MVVEYLLLLLISITIIAASFGINTGPSEMLKRKSPNLAYIIQNNMQTGAGFQKPGEGWID
ncbi:MAG: hypothetical protein GDA46_00780 [Bdellovibrionales bacterium]|nr:hypothetical protein [Bdellovibrionales bacterium]